MWGPLCCGEACSTDPCSLQDEISEFLCTVLTSSVTDSYERPEFDLEHRKKRDKDKDKDKERKKRIHRDLSLELKGRRAPSAGRGRRNSLPTTSSEVKDSEPLKSVQEIFA